MIDASVRHQLRDIAAKLTNLRGSL
ncbi:peptide chain release factor 2, partial [Paenibacillus melissococcoides]